MKGVVDRFGRFRKEHAARHSGPDTVSPRPRAQIDCASIDLRVHLYLFDDIAGAFEARRVHGHVTRQPIEIRQRVTSEIGLDGPGEVCLRLSGEDGGKVELLNGDLALHRLTGRDDVRYQTAVCLPCRRADVHRDAKLVQRSIQLELERGLQCDALERRHEPGDFWQGDFLGRELEIENRFGQVVTDGAARRQRRFLGFQGDLVQIDLVVSNRYAAGQGVQLQRGIGRCEARDSRSQPNTGPVRT